MIPIGDYAGERPRFPFVNYALILINIVVFIVELSKPETFISQWGVVPREIVQGTDLPPTIGVPIYVTLLTSIFLHAGWLHLGGNMLYLWIFGDNVEDRMGHGRFLVFYLLCGVAAALAQTVTAPNSTVPMVGASGAIAGVMGAYFVLYPKSRIVALVPLFFFFQIIEVPAIFFLGIWFLMQFVSGVGSIAEATRGAPGGGVAFWAHVAGFVAGITGVVAFRRPERERVEWWHDT